MPFGNGPRQDLFITLCKNSTASCSRVFLWIIIAHPAALSRHSESAKEHFIIYFGGFKGKITAETSFKRTLLKQTTSD